jgi:hypothetical protein
LLFNIVGSKHSISSRLPLRSSSLFIKPAFGEEDPWEKSILELYICNIGSGIATLAYWDSMHLKRARPLSILGEAIVLTGDLDLFCA